VEEGWLSGVKLHEGELDIDAGLVRRLIAT
jgi:hypothetical protein